MKSLGALVLIASAAAVHAQTFPSKPLRIYTQFGPGTPGEIVARVVADRMTVSMGQPVIVESRAGGGGVLAGSLTARAAPDGYTLAALTSTVPVISAVLSRDLPFDPVKELTPITTLVRIPAVLAAHPAFPPNNLKELIEYARSNPGKVSYGTTGVGSSFHLTMEQARMLTGAAMEHIPYKTSPVLDAVTGAIQFAFVVVPQAMPLIKAGKVKPIGVVSPQRTRLLPEVATMLETVPGFELVPEWTGLFGPAGLPQPVLRRIHADAVAGINQPEARDRLAAGGYDIITTASPGDYSAQLKRDLALVARIVKAAGLKAE